MSDKSEKRAHLTFIMTIVQTICAVVSVLMALGAVIGHYVSRS
ncbi:hypothetical protein [Saccharibacter sp. 17.LH.SD]|nr:hypothetical protein [Saccharibacter sp. 17.LH.SD]